MFGKATRRQWRTNALVNAQKIQPVTAPGFVVAIDQMISETPGLVAQMTGFITRKRYKLTTVFVDHFSGFTKVMGRQSQNGHAEKKIRNLQDLTRTMLLHAQHRWPSAITANLWHFAIRMANDDSSTSPGIKGGIPPHELFAQVQIDGRRPARVSRRGTKRHGSECTSDCRQGTQEKWR